MTLGTGFFNDFTFAAANLAGPGLHEAAEGSVLGKLYLSGAAAVLTGFGGSPRLGAGTLTGITSFLAGHFNILLQAESGLFKSYIQVEPEVGAFNRPAPALAAASPEKHFEYIPESAKVGSAEAAVSLTVGGSVTKLIIPGSFVRVGQDLIGFGHFFKFCLGFLVIRIHVRVVFPGQFPVSLLDFGFTGIPANPQYLIVVTLAHFYPLYDIVVSKKYS
jgi:hypothetical protein